MRCAPRHCRQFHFGDRVVSAECALLGGMVNDGPNYVADVFDGLRRISARHRAGNELAHVIGGEVAELYVIEVRPAMPALESDTGIDSMRRESPFDGFRGNYVLQNGAIMSASCEGRAFDVTWY